MRALRAPLKGGGGPPVSAMCAYRALYCAGFRLSPEWQKKAGM